MSRRSFIFCDICNPMGIRAVEMRRTIVGRDPRMGRRVTDGRKWFEGNDEEARAAGWLVAADSEQHICPSCFARLHAMRDVLMEKLQVSEEVLETLINSQAPR